MRFLSVSETDVVYICSQSHRIAMHLAQYPELGKFSKALYRFAGSLGDMATDSYWGPAMRRLKLLQFDLCAAPFSAKYIEDRCSSTVAWLQEYLQPSSSMYPRAAEDGLSVCELLEDVCGNPRAPLLEKLRELVGAPEGIKIAILIGEPRLIPPTQDQLRLHKELSDCEVIAPANLREGVIGEMLLAIGPPQWFPEYVFMAPRAPKVAILAYDWMRIWWKPAELFMAPFAGSGIVEEVILQHKGEEDEGIDPEALVPAIDFKQVFAAGVGRAPARDEDEAVEARAYVLDQGWAVLLEAGETSSALVVDLDENLSDRVRRIRAREIERGTYILLRTSGGGDYIVPVANRILADFESTARQHQRDWKVRLRTLFRKHGPAHVTENLRRLGSVRANDTNLHNWMSERNIRTQDPEDFTAIMRLIGLGEQAEEYWRIMGLIDKAHKMAGFRIRRLLLEEVDRMDLQGLERIGMMTIELPDKDAGSLGIFRVLSVSPTVELVPASDIGEPFPIEQNGQDASSQSLLWD